MLKIEKPFWDEGGEILVISGCVVRACCREFIEGPCWTINRPPCIVEVHTSVAKASFALGSILQDAAAVQLDTIHCTGAPKSQKLKQFWASFWPHYDNFIFEIFTPGRESWCQQLKVQHCFIYCGLDYWKCLSIFGYLYHSHVKWAWDCIALKIWFLLSALKMCWACAMTLMLALFKYEKKKLASINNIKPLASETCCNQAFEVWNQLL